MTKIAALNSEPKPKSRRIRRTPEAARDSILVSAHGLLIEQGPQAVTLNALAEATGMTHGNVRHHFGSSSFLQAALIEYATVNLSVRLGDSVAGFEAGDLTLTALVTAIFDAFRDSGCGRLVGWCSASGEEAMLSPIFAAIKDHLRQLRAMEPTTPFAISNMVGPIALSVISFALTASLLDNQFEKALHAPEGCLQALALEALSRGGPTDY